MAKFYQFFYILLSSYHGINYPGGNGTWQIAAPKWPLTDGRVKISAAWLIENSGIHKGEEVGGARISTKHVLALTNAVTATASDIATLARKARDQVQNTFGITLEAEVNLIGIEI